MRTRVAALITVALIAFSPSLISGEKPKLVLKTGEKPKLVLKAPRLHMLSPGRAARGIGKRVEIRARLEGDPEYPKELYCLDEVWDWGDGTESVYEPDCDPFEEGTELKRNFFESHAFGPGRWFVTLALMNGDDVVIDGTVQIRIY